MATSAPPGQVEHRGFVLIADITGYTAYLNASELEHAQGTLTDLLELIVEQTRSPLVVAQLEGDAVMSYALQAGSVSGQTFLESIENTYVAFRRAIESMVLNNTCQCSACANVESLDLKFFIHFGPFVLQRIGGINQLVGRDINLIHRLLKNSVTAATGIRAYILCTTAAIGALGLETEGMIEHEETVADFGQVPVSIMDMHPVYEAKRDEELVEYGPDEVLLGVSTEISLPPATVWDYLNQSEFRNLLSGDDRREILDRQSGRIGQGSTYMCYHGKMIIPQLVLEWKPFDRVLLRQQLPFPGHPTHVLLDFRLSPSENGTTLHQTVARATGTALKRSLARAMITMGAGGTRRDMARFRDHVEEDFTARQATTEPAIPVSTDQEFS